MWVNIPYIEHLGVCKYTIQTWIRYPWLCGISENQKKETLPTDWGFFRISSRPYLILHAWEKITRFWWILSKFSRRFKQNTPVGSELKFEGSHLNKSADRHMFFETPQIIRSSPLPKLPSNTPQLGGTKKPTWKMLIGKLPPKDAIVTHRIQQHF